MKILLIPDAHNTQGSDLSRYVGLGQQVIARERPDKIIIGGDFIALNSISHWDKDKRLTMEGQRYQAEINTTNVALDLIQQPIHHIQARQREQKIKLYNPDLEYIMGNHEYWVDKYLEQNPQMQGHVDLVKDLRLQERGWNITPYKSYLEINDILFTHVPMNGGCQAISGSDICTVASRYVSKSTVFFHSHRLETKNFRRVGQSNGVMQILTAGCFFEEDSESSFSINNWKGVIILDVFAPGRFEIKTYSIERLRYEV